MLVVTSGDVWKFDNRAGNGGDAFGRTDSRPCVIYKQQELRDRHKHQGVVSTGLELFDLGLSNVFVGGFVPVCLLALH